jgi:hypothetical protein
VGRWSEVAWVLNLLFLVYLVYHHATTISKQTDTSMRHLYLVKPLISLMTKEVDVNKKQIGAAAFVVMLVVPFPGAIVMALIQPGFEHIVFYGIAATALVSIYLWEQAYSSFDNRRLRDLISYVE